MYYLLGMQVDQCACNVVRHLCSPTGQRALDSMRQTLKTLLSSGADSDESSYHVVRHEAAVALPCEATRLKIRHDQNTNSSR